MLKKAAALSLLLIASSASAMEINEVLDRLRSKESQISNLSFDFSQTVHFEAVGEPSTITGKAVIGKGNKLRISKASPQEQVTVSNGKKVWVYTPAFSQVWVGDWTDWSKTDALAKGLIPLNNFVEELERNYNLALEKNGKDGRVAIRAVPKGAPDVSMLIHVSTSLWLPVETVYLSGSAKVETILSHYELNKKLPGDEFDFKSPPGTEEISLN